MFEYYSEENPVKRLDYAVKTSSSESVSSTSTKAVIPQMMYFVLSGTSSSRSLQRRRLDSSTVFIAFNAGFLQPRGVSKYASNASPPSTIRELLSLVPVYEERE